jgi:hypothetical protein
MLFLPGLRRVLQLFVYYLSSYSVFILTMFWECRWLFCKAQIIRSARSRESG